MLQIEPFPRARIMKICYNFLEQVKIGIPEDWVDRIYFEERTKYVMEITDKIEDVQELEDHFGVDSIELFIQNLARQL
jgi:NADH dehydrogenase (ubiquinone) 1 alpha subcomplex subunit 5